MVIRLGLGYGKIYITSIGQIKNLLKDFKNLIKKVKLFLILPL